MVCLRILLYLISFLEFSSKSHPIWKHCASHTHNPTKQSCSSNTFPVPKITVHKGTKNNHINPKGGGGRICTAEQKIQQGQIIVLLGTERFQQHNIIIDTAKRGGWCKRMKVGNQKKETTIQQVVRPMIHSVSWGNSTQVSRVRRWGIGWVLWVVAV